MTNNDLGMLIGLIILLAPVVAFRGRTAAGGIVTTEESMSLISALIMILVLSCVAATILFALIRWLQPHRRNVYPHPVGQAWRRSSPVPDGQLRGRRADNRNR